MYVLLERPGHPPQRIKVDGDEAVIGRAPNCDVVVEEEFVSKQHLRILSGLVAVDVSSNGTFVEGQRILGGVLPAGRPMQLADSDITIRIEPDEAALSQGASSQAPFTGDATMAAAPFSHPPGSQPMPPLAAPKVDPALAKKTTMLQEQLKDAAKRLEQKAAKCKKLESEVENNASAIADAAKETATLRQQATALRDKIAELEAKALEPKVVEPKPPTDGSAAGLLLFNVQRENAQLKKALAQHKASASAEAAKLAAAQSEVASQLAAAKAAGVAAGTPVPSAAASDGAQAASSAAPATPAQPGTAAPGNLGSPVEPGLPAKPGKVALPFGDVAEPVTTPPPGAPNAAGLPDAVVPMAMNAASPIAAGGQAASGGSADLNRNRLLEFLRQDAEAMAVRHDDPLDAFLLVEGFRFLRRMERVVTRLAGGLIQLYQNQTMVPGVGGNLRQLLADVAANPTKPHARTELLSYLKELGRWLVVALSAYRKAAEGLASQIKSDVTAEALTASDPISMVKRVAGQGDAELWRRVCEYMKTLSYDEITERVEKLARKAADELTEGESASEEANSFG